MLKLKEIQKKYSGFELNCSLEVPDGCIVGLIGANGAGKSTLFKTILGLEQKDGGELELFGRNVDKVTRKELEKIGVVFSEAGPNGYLDIKSYLPILTSAYQTFEEKKFLEGCRNARLPQDKPIKEFSTGMKKKLQILIALSHHPDLLLLDEPTSGLDVVARDEILDWLRTYMEEEGRSILISSHISGDLEGFCDDIYMIDQGNIVLHEEADRLLEEYGLLKVTKEQYQKLDKSYILRVKEEPFGYQCLTNEKQFYLENYPGMIIEKSGIDILLYMMIRGEVI